MLSSSFLRSRARTEPFACLAEEAAWRQVKALAKIDVMTNGR